MMANSLPCDSLLARFRHTVARMPDRLALIAAEQTMTFATLEEQTERLAYAMRDDGVLPGARVALLLGNSVAFLLAYLAIRKLGAVVVPINPVAPTPAILGILADCTPTACFTEARHRALFSTLSAQVPSLQLVYLTEPSSAHAREGQILLLDMHTRMQYQGSAAPLAGTEESTLATIVYTSGTTGVPKGVMLSHANHTAIATAGQSLLDLSERDRIGIVTPLFHLYGLREIDTTLSVGATLVLPRDMTYPARVLEQLRTTQTTGFSAVPSGLTLVVNRYNSLLADCAPHLRHITIGTALAPPALLARLRHLLPTTRLLVTYGLTEASRVCWREVIDPAQEPMSGAVGQPYPGVAVWLVDEADGIGQVAVRSALVMQGYWHRPAATQLVLMTDGSLLTPDYGRFDANGMLSLLGRMDEVINCGGQKVSPEEVEAVLSQHPAVAAVAVVGAPDPAGVLGEVVRAFVVRSPGAAVSAQELQAYTAAVLEPYKIPRWIEFVARLPRAALGKLQRTRLRAQA